MNARDFISSALRAIGVIASGETPSASDAQGGLSALNMMIGSWSTQPLTLMALKRESFTMVPGQGSYTIGDGGDFDTAKPMNVIGAAYFDVSTSLEIAMEILPYQKWMDISLKDMQSTIPTQVYIHGESPLEKLSFWPVPSESCGLILYSKKELTQFPDLDTEIELPPGYDRAIKYNLAIELASEYEREAPAAFVKIASDSLAKIKIKNSPTRILKSDVTNTCSGSNHLSNIFSGGK